MRKQQVYEIDLLQEWRVRVKRSTSGEMVAIEWCPLKSSDDGTDNSRPDEVDDDVQLRTALVAVLERTTKPELKIICLTLMGSIESEDLLNKSKPTIISRIISYYERRKTLSKVASYLKQKYPDYMYV